MTITARLKSAPPLILTHLPHESSEGGAERDGEGGHNGAHVGVEMNYNEPLETAGKNIKLNDALTNENSRRRTFTVNYVDDAVGSFLVFAPPQN